MPTCPLLMYTLTMPTELLIISRFIRRDDKSDQEQQENSPIIIDDAAATAQGKIPCAAHL